jgi:hypothetical protein
MVARSASATEHRTDAEASGRASSHIDVVTDALWLTTLQTLCGRAAHDVRGALNAVAVNLEVTRSRAEKPGVPASSVSAYANIAAAQLEGVIAMTEALLHLARAARVPLELGAEVSRMVSLLVPTMRAAGRTIELDNGFGRLGTTSARTSSARLAIGHCLLAAADRSASVRCVPEDTADRPRLCIEHGTESISLDADVLDVLAAVHIDVRSDPAAIVITFPR